MALVPGLAPEPSQTSHADGGGGADLDLVAGVGLFEGDLEIVAQILAARGAAAALLAAPEHVAEDIAEHVVEDVVDVAEAGLAAATGLAVDAGMAEAVVGRALLRIRQDRIGLVDFLELGGGVGAAAVAVRMVLHRQLAEGRLEGRAVAILGRR